MVLSFIKTNKHPTNTYQESSRAGLAFQLLKKNLYKRRYTIVYFVNKPKIKRESSLTTSRYNNIGSRTRFHKSLDISANEPHVNLAQIYTIPGCTNIHYTRLHK